MSFNKIIIVGNLGRDPELKYTSQGTAVCKMSVATSEKRKDQSTGEQVEHTTWFRVSVWGRQAELCNEYLAKGRQVYIEGRFRMEEYTDREGNQKFSPEVNATDVQFIGSRRDDDGQGGGERPARQSAKPSGSSGARQSKSVSLEEDEIPF